MKRAIIIEIILFLNLAILIAVNTNLWRSINSLITVLNKIEEPILQQSLNTKLGYGISALLGIVFVIAAIILTAFKEFPPLKDKYNAHKEKRSADKAVRNEKNKQQKIQALEKQLEELKKD